MYSSTRCLPPSSESRQPYSHSNHPTDSASMQDQPSEMPPPYSEDGSRASNVTSLPSNFSRAIQNNEPNHYQHYLAQPEYSVTHGDNFPETNLFRTPARSPKLSRESNLPSNPSNLNTKENGYNDQSYALRRAAGRSPNPPLSQYLAQYSQQQPDSSHASNDSDLSEQQILENALAFYHNARPPPSRIPPLIVPIAIPQTIPGSGQAFARAWAPSISTHGIYPVEFLAFIDGLNIVSTANPPLQILNLAGGLVGMVPYHWAAIAGIAIQATAQVGTAAVSKGRTEMYLKEANEKFFAPRRLIVSIASRDAVDCVVRLPRDAPMLQPLTRESMSVGLVERSLTVMRGYVAELDFDVPPMAEQTTTLAKMSAKQIERSGKRNEKKALKEREKVLEKVEKEREKNVEKQEKERAKIEDTKEKSRGRRRSDSGSSENTGRRKSSKERKREWSRGKKERSRERKEKKRQEKAEKEHAKHGKNEKDKEAKKAAKLLWILIENKQ